MSQHTDSAGRVSKTHTTWIAFAALLLGTLGGVFLGAKVGALRPAARDPAGDDDLARSLESIRTELERLRQVVESGPTLADPPAVSRREGVDTSADLDALVGRLEQALVQLERSAPTHSPRPRLVGQGRSSIAEIEAEVATRWPSDQEGVIRDLSRAHYLWTVEEVIARYGMPNYEHQNSALYLIYGFGGDASDHTKPHVRFGLAQGTSTASSSRSAESPTRHGRGGHSLATRA